ncbi:MAG: monovalent cation/H+ antiporter complex subunit F [Bacillota bacterium]
MTLLEGFILATLGLMVIAIAAALVRLIIGPTIWDRLLMVNLISAKVVMFVALYAVFVDNILILDIAISYGIIGFLTITLLSKYIMTGGREK